jgi:hypothetical protein
LLSEGDNASHNVYADSKHCQQQQQQSVAAAGGIAMDDDFDEKGAVGGHTTNA